MAQNDWKTSLIAIVMIFAALRFFVYDTNDHSLLSITNEKLVYHSNWTSSYNALPQLNTFHQALRLDDIK